MIYDISTVTIVGRDLPCIANAAETFGSPCKCVKEVLRELWRTRKFCTVTFTTGEVGTGYVNVLARLQEDFSPLECVNEISGYWLKPVNVLNEIPGDQ